MAVVAGSTTRTFRDEDDFERLLGAFEAPGELDGDRGASTSATHATWAADGSALAVATRGGDVHVVTRVGRLAHTQRGRSRPRGARGEVAGVALAAVAGGGGWTLVVVAGANPRRATGDAGRAHRRRCAGPFHAQRVRDVDVDGGVEVSDENVGECRTLLSEKKGVEKRRSSALPGASFSSPLGMEWHERRRLLIVAGRGDQGGGVGVGVWRYGGGDDDEFLVPIAFTASRGGGPVGGGVGGGGGASGLVGYLLGVPPPSCAVAFRCDDDDDDDADVGDARRAHVAVVDPEGALHVWRADAARLAGASSAAAAAMTLEPVALAASASDSGCCSIAWWSRDALAIARVDGDVTVSTIPEMRNALGSKAETFEGAPSLAACARGGGGGERVVVLETPPPEASSSSSSSTTTTTTSTTRWRLATINARTPQEMLQAHLDAEEWGVAASLAAARGLDADDVHKARWLASTPGRESIHDALSKVSDKAWATAQCVVAVAESYEQQRVVIVHGLRETEKHAAGKRRSGETASHTTPFAL